MTELLGIAAIKAKRTEYAAAMLRNRREGGVATVTADRQEGIVWAFEYALDLLGAETPAEQRAALEAVRRLVDTETADTGPRKTRAVPTEQDLFDSLRKECGSK